MLNEKYKFKEFLHINIAIALRMVSGFFFMRKSHRNIPISNEE